MIVAQMSAVNIATVAPAGTGATKFQVSTLGVTNGLTAGDATLTFGSGIILGLPFKVTMAGHSVVLTTAFTILAGLVLAGPAGAAPTASARDANVSGSMAVGTHNWYCEFNLNIDGSSQALIGHSFGTSAAGTVGALKAVAELTGFTGLPAQATPYSWPARITGLDTAIQNSPIGQLVPQVTYSATSGGSITTLDYLVISQG